ncbi:MAG: DUF2802 domain-containing protein [Natronospirillum sp.]
MQFPSEYLSVVLAFASSAALTVLLLAVWLRARTARNRLYRHLARLEDELAIIQAGNIGLGKKLLAVNRQLQGLGSLDESVTLEAQGGGASWAVDEAAPQASHWAEQVDESEYASAAHQNTDVEPEFDRAQQLLAEGMGIDQVVQLTGLTRSEAELIQLLHPITTRPSARSFL